MEKSLKSFENFMSEYWPEYIKNPTGEKSITYIYDELGKRPNPIIALILFLLGFFPGILYILIGGKPSKKHVVKVQEDEKFKMSGDGIKDVKKSYNKYIQKDGENFNIKFYKNNYASLIAATVIWVIVLVFIFVLFVI